MVGDRKSNFLALFYALFSLLIAIFVLKFIATIIPDEFNFENWQIFIWIGSVLLLPAIIPKLAKYISVSYKTFIVSRSVSIYSKLFWFSQLWILLLVSQIQENIPFIVSLQGRLNLVINNKSCILASLSLICILYLAVFVIIVFIIKKKPPSLNKDLPDLYGREPYTNRLALLITNHLDRSEIIATTSTNEISPTIWLNAEWGQGKTFVIKQLKQKLLEDDDGLVVVEFQPTDYVINDNNIERIVQSFYQEVIARISEKYFIPELSSQLRKYSKIITQKAQETLLGFSPLDMFEEPEDIKRTISETLTGNNIKLVLIYDDIDRLLPKETLLFLKLVRITNNFDNTISLISASINEVGTRVQKALEIKDPELFVSKFYDLRSDLPPIPPEKLYDKLALELKGVFGEEKDTYDELEVIFRDVHFSGETHHECISNIRKQEQLVSEFKRFKAYKNEFCWEDIIKISVIKLFNGGTIYQLLSQSKSNICGMPAHQNPGDKEKNPFFTELDKIFEKLGSNEQNIIKRFLCEMFPKIATKYDGFDFSTDRVFAISDHDYFDRYFSEVWLNDWLQLEEINEIKQELSDNKIEFTGFNPKALSWVFRMFNGGKNHFQLSLEEKKNLSVWLIQQKANEVEYVDGIFKAEAEDYITYQLPYDQPVLETLFKHGKHLSDAGFFDAFQYVNKIYWNKVRDQINANIEESYLEALASIALENLVEEIGNLSDSILKLHDDIDKNAEYIGYFRNVGSRLDKDCCGGRFKIEEIFVTACKNKIKENVEAFIVYTLSYRDYATRNGKIDWKEEWRSNPFMDNTPKELFSKLSKQHLQKTDIPEKYEKYLRRIIKILKVETSIENQE